MKQVLVLMSTFNGEHYLAQQLDSIFSQKGCEVKVCVRDDGSEDGTVPILRKYALTHPLTFIQGVNRGPAESFLQLIIQAADSPYYALADQDDIWDSRKLEAALKALESYKEVPALYCSDLTVTDENLNVTEDLPLPSNVQTDFRSAALDPGYYFGCTMVFNRNLKKVIEKRGMPSSMIMHDLWLAMTASYCGRLIYDPRSFIRYRNHASKYTVQRKKAGLFEKLAEVKEKRNCSIAEQCASFMEYFGFADDIHSTAGIISRYPSDKTARLKVCAWIMRRKDMKASRKIKTILRVLYKTY